MRFLIKMFESTCTGNCNQGRNCTCQPTSEEDYIEQLFTKWFNQQELYGLKSERFYDLIDMMSKAGNAYHRSAVSWLRAAYAAGFDEGKTNGK